MRRICALLLLGLAVAGLATTVVVGRADAADQRGDFARAVWWRPGVPLYHRHYGEQLLLSSPQQSEQQLLLAAREDPYDPLTMADLSEVELALGNWPQAVSLSRSDQGAEPSFENYWRLANLFLAHRDLGGYWSEAQLAAAAAADEDFASIVSRGLSASDNDFAQLRRTLPADSVAAASAYTAAATEGGNGAAALAGAHWLLSLHPPRLPNEQAAREDAMGELFAAAWRQWPDAVETVWRESGAAGLLPLPAKTAAAPYLLDPDFSPADYRALRQFAPDATAPLSGLLGWQWAGGSGVRGDQVRTGDAAHPTALELIFDGTEGDGAACAQQWILGRSGANISVQVWGRRLENPAAEGMVLRLSNREGQAVGEVPIATGTDWAASAGSFRFPGGEAAGEEAFQVSVAYHRPSGLLPLRNRILITGIELQ